MVSRKKIAFSVVIVSGILLRGYIFTNLDPILSRCSADFSPCYAAGKLLGTPDLYNSQAVFNVQDKVSGLGCHADWAVFIKPPFYVALMWPLAQLPYITAIAIWRILGLLALI